MVIAVNTRLLLHERLEGIGRFTDETLKILTRKHREHTFVFIFDREYSDRFLYSDNIIPVKGFPPARHPLLWQLFFEHSVPRILTKYKADVFLSPDGWLSLNTGITSLPVIHDINFFRHPEFIPAVLRKYYGKFFPLFVSKASRIATVSEFSRNEIADYFGYDRNRIDVVGNAAGDSFCPLPLTGQEEVRQKLTGGMPYFLFTGLIHPRKNVPGLIKAWEGFRSSSGSGVKLVIAGSLKWKSSDLDYALKISPYRNDIIFTGRLGESDLRRVTASALAMVYISFYEGFGLPVVEAMNCDVPVIASSVSAIPETGGNAVFFADPYSVDSVKNAMLAVFRDEKLRNELISKGRINRKRFSWERTADLLWDSIIKTIIR